MKSITELLENKSINKRYDEVVQFMERNGMEEDRFEEASETLDVLTEYFYGLFNGKNMDGTPLKENLDKVDFTEATKTDDLSVVIPRVFNTILQEPVEPAYFLMNQVAEEIRMASNDPLSIEFPSMGAAIAEEIGENGEYPNLTLSFARNQVFMKIRKYGGQANLSEELVKASQYPLMALHLRMLKSAIDRKGESLLFDTMQATAHVVFDNESTDAEYQTSGVDSANAANYAFTYTDLIKMCSVLVGHRYQATHMLAHPMAYSIFSLDPFLKAQFVHLGQIGGQIWNTPPQENMQSVTPFGIAYVPYYALDFNENSQLAAGPGTGLDPTLLTDIYVIDQRNSLYFANKGPAELDSREDWFKDATTMKCRRYMAVSAKDGGRGMARAKKIRVEESFNPLYTIRTV